MKKLVTLVAASSVIMASSLMQDAKNAGLQPIPSDKKALMKLIDNPANPITQKKAELGKMLFFEPRISKSGLISCNTCHNLAIGGDDNLPAAVGHKWRQNPHHLGSPTVYNAVFNDVQFWDGRAKDLEAQAQGPILASPEMAATKESVVKTITSMPAYVKLFEEAYGKDVKIDYETITKTIGLFERTLVTPSRYDAFLQGNDAALTQGEKKGLGLFIQKGCVSCHNGVGLGGSMAPFEVAAKYKYRDVGDFKGDKNGMVKVPTLRNITETAPYFHNGQITTLQEAIKEMGRVQLGVKITSEEAKSIEQFLGALKGEKPRMSYPILPEENANTPKLDIK